MNMGKAVAIDAASTTTSYWTGYACNEIGLLLPLTLMFSMAASMGTSYGVNKLAFIDSIKIEKVVNDKVLTYVSDEDLAKINSWKYRPDDNTLFVILFH